MRKLTADWIFPVSSFPIKKGVVITDGNGRILAVGERKNFEDAELEIHHGIICPGFINAHCHLELSYLKGKISEHTGLVGFISEFLKKRNDDDMNVRESIEAAEKEMMNEGIVGVGDISNTMVSFEQKSKNHLHYHTFVECFGVQPVRGSSSRRGPQALLELTSWAERGYDLSITPDGPRGPCYVVQEGVMSLAQLTALPIVPVSFYMRRKIQLKSWDRFQIPLPFSRCEMILEKPTRVPRDATTEEREALRQQLQQALAAITRD